MARSASTPPQAPPRRARPDDDPVLLLHELRVHQAELESQNDELRRTQDDLAAARDRFVDLYDFAPVGYMTIDASGVIVEANLTAATLFGIERRALIGRSFVRHIAAGGTDAWHRHVVQTHKSETSRRIELALMREGSELLHGQLDCLRLHSEPAQPMLRIALTDVTRRHKAEATRRIADAAIEAQEAERHRAAHELHEELGQRLSVLKMDLAALLPSHGKDTASQQPVEAMLSTLDEAVALLRRVTSELAPLMLRDLGLHAAVDWLVHDVARRSGRPIELLLDGDEPPIAERTAVALYRIAQDLLEPLVRSADTTAVMVRMHRLPAEITLSVEAGRGPWQSSDAGVAGLRHTLHDRAHLLGAHIDQHDTSAGRCRTTVHLPLPRTAPAGVGRSMAPP